MPAHPRRRLFGANILLGALLITPAAAVSQAYFAGAVVVRVTHCGRICMGRRKINLSRVFAGELVGLREVDDQVWLVSFLDVDLGFFDQDEGRVEPAQNPFGPEKVLTMSPE